MEENYYYCPICGHKFVQVESDYNNDTADTNFNCPDCDWEGTQDEVIDLSIVALDLFDALDDESINLTTNDAEKVIKELETKSYDEAIKSVAQGILDSLDTTDDDKEEDDDEEVDLSDKLEVYEGSYNKRTLKKEGTADNIIDTIGGGMYWELKKYAPKPYTKESLMKLFRTLAHSQELYAKLVESIEEVGVENDLFLQKIEDQHFTTELDVILYVECTDWQELL